ncbi:MAG: helix-turn-helix domain-containing protein, partial [Desulfobulbaceae bacterium]|nr:helix-turn-helix domain-containing protein [Desulfobulbaceae bacterium]
MTNDSPGTPSEETSPEQVPAPPHESMGQYLQRGRIHKNISRETVAEATCIHASTLLALEEDDYEKLPADVFTRGFIKIYANQLGLDAQKALHLYQPGAKKRSGIDERSGRHQPILPGELLAEASPLTFGRQFLIFLLILLVAWLGFLFFQSDTFNAEGPKQPPTVTGQTTPPPAMEPTAAITVPAEQPLTPPATVAPQQVAPPIVDTAGNTTGVDRGGIT